MGNKAKMYIDIMALNPEVTGSCLLCVLKTPNREVTRFIVDCGLFQEESYDEFNYSFPFNCDNIDFALLTHNHVDHTGRLPFLYKKGYKGKIYCSNQTKVLLPLALEDSCKVLKDVCKRQNRKQLYTEVDVNETIRNTIGVQFEEKIHITENVDVTFLKNGHLIGATMILVEINYPNEEAINILFTGDYNNKNLFFNIDEIPTEILDKRLNIFIESTYGEMNSADIVYNFNQNLLEQVEKGNSIIIPVFSLGRAQEILLRLKKLQMQNKLDISIPIYFDGKLAHNYTNLFLKSEIILEEKRRDFLPQNIYMVDSDSRQELLNTDECKIIVTTSGMATYGPAQVYLPYFIPKKNAAVIFTGYTAPGTLGRNLQDAENDEIVKVGGLLLKKKASVLSTNEFSAHAKSDELIELIKKFKNVRAVIVNHGETGVKEIFATKIINKVDPPSVGILNREYFFRLDTWGVNKTLPTKFK